MDGQMNDLRLYILFNAISVTSRLLESDTRLCGMEQNLNNVEIIAREQGSSIPPLQPQLQQTINEIKV